MRISLRALGMLVVAIAALPVGALASPITVTLTGNASGSVGDRSFVAKNFTIVGIGNSDDRDTINDSDGFFIDHISATTLVQIS